MRSTRRRSNRNRSMRNRKMTNRFLGLMLAIVVIGILVGGGLFVKGLLQDDVANDSVDPQTQTDPDSSNQEIPINDPEPEPEPEPKETFTQIRIAATGDIMVHGSQIKSAHDASSGTYNFKPMFEDVKPILSAADLSLANFETTTAGATLGFRGYPQFNSPDEVVDAIKYAGIDVLTTANNHSLDTGIEGLKRTLKVMRDKGLATVGTYDEQSDSRILVKDVEGIRIAILSYTESTNGLGAQYSSEQLHAMLNMMTRENITRDVQEAKAQEADFIIAFMHWGQEYMPEPNDTQVELAQMMAEEGVDLILGSHPHVIQKSDIIEANGKQTYVVYSMGNFISNQRKETLGDRFEPTEDGIIINFDIEKNDQTGETVLKDVEYVPTWVYRNWDEGNAKYAYRILPIENFLISDEISAAYKARMERSFDATISKMYDLPGGKN